MGIKELKDSHKRLLESVDPLRARVRDLSQAYATRKQEHRFSLFSSSNHERLEQISFIRSIADGFDDCRTTSDSTWVLSSRILELARAKRVIYGACLFVMKEIGSTYYLGSPCSSQLYSELADLTAGLEDDALHALKEHLSDEDNQDGVNFGSQTPEVVLEKLAAYTGTSYTASAAAAAP